MTTASDAVSVEFTADGALRMSAEVAEQFFPNDAMIAVNEGAHLLLVPLIGPQGGGLYLKRRNLRGDRSALIWEALGERETPVGDRAAVWDPDKAALRIALD